mmetsp:Transcript_21507/g.53136  ORF Transcript_21507/g.53136 Transcript_21507/m.53136 type:complete len:343 (-) Transcript_21507:2038-3066(-)
MTTASTLVTTSSTLTAATSTTTSTASSSASTVTASISVASLRLATASSMTVSMAVIVLPVVVLESMVATESIQQTLVGFYQRGSLLCELQCHDLKRIWLNLAKDNSFSWLIPASKQLAVDHHSGNNTVHLVLSHLKHATQLTEGERIVLSREGEKVGSQSFQFNLGSQHSFDCVHSIFSSNKIPHLELITKISTCLPVTLHQCLRCAHDIVTSLFRWSCEHLMFIYVAVLAECSGDGAQSSSTNGLRTDSNSSHVWNLKKHSTDQMASFKQIQVDVLVVRNLTALLCLFLLWGLLGESAHADTLCKKFTNTSRADFGETLVGLPDSPLSEGTHSKCNHHAVV